MIKRLEPTPKLSKGEEESLSIAEWIWSSHYWIEELPGGNYRCKWCGAYRWSTQPICIDDPLCPKNPAIDRLLTKVLGDVSEEIDQKLMSKIKIFIDAEGNEYLPEEIIFCDIDTPGPQFMGYVTLESKRKTNCIDDWVEVKIRDDINRDIIPIQEIAGGEIVKGVKYYGHT